ncbi:MAG: hypothetical protein RR382_00785 [Tannerellaceae bacterium]
MADQEKMDFASEFPEGADVVTEGPVEGAEAAEAKTYTLADGSQGSRAAFIREKFLVENMSRKDISETYDLPYRIVYSATVNMTNTAEASTRGRTAVNSTIKVTADGKYVTVKDGVTYANDEVIEDPATLGELEEVNRNNWIKEQVDAGVSRGDIAKYLDMSYGVIYGLTKEQEGTRARIEIALEDGKTVSRAEYIRMQFAAGVSRGDIAKALDVPYSVVWQATKTEKTVADHFAELLTALKTYADKVDNTDLFGQVTAALDTIKIKEPVEAPAAEAAAE